MSFRAGSPRRTVALAAVTLIACLLTASVLFVALYTPKTIPPAFVKGDPMDCTGGFTIGITEGTVFRPGADSFPVYSVHGVRILGGIMKAGFRGGFMEGDGAPGGAESFSAELNAGESATHSGVGTFTLLSVSPSSVFDLLRPGGGGTASFCFQPEPTFELGEGFADRIG